MEAAVEQVFVLNSAIGTHPLLVNKELANGRNCTSNQLYLNHFNIVSERLISAYSLIWCTIRAQNRKGRLAAVLKRLETMAGRQGFEPR
jgi:hypothetical protein